MGRDPKFLHPMSTASRGDVGQDAALTLKRDSINAVFSFHPQWERLWFLILTSSFFLTLVWFYFWWEVHNDYNEINWWVEFPCCGGANLAQICLPSYASKSSLTLDWIHWGPSGGLVNDSEGKMRWEVRLKQSCFCLYSLIDVMCPYIFIAWL